MIVFDWNCCQHVLTVLIVKVLRDRESESNGVLEAMGHQFSSRTAHDGSGVLTVSNDRSGQDSSALSAAEPIETVVDHPGNEFDSISDRTKNGIGIQVISEIYGQIGSRVKN